MNHFRSQAKQKGWRRFSLGFNNAATPTAVVGEKEGLKSSTSLQYLPEDIQDMSVGPASHARGFHLEKDKQMEQKEDTERSDQDNDDKDPKKLPGVSVSHENKDRSGNGQQNQEDPEHKDLQCSSLAQHASEVGAEQEEPQGYKETDKEKVLSDVKGNAEESGCTLEDIREHDHDATHLERDKHVAEIVHTRKNQDQGEDIEHMDLSLGKNVSLQDGDIGCEGIQILPITPSLLFFLN